MLKKKIMQFTQHTLSNGFRFFSNDYSKNAI